MIFKYLLGTNQDAPIGYLNSDFIQHVEEIKHRNLDGVQLKVHLLNGNAAVVRDEFAERLRDWYDAQAEAKTVAAPTRGKGRSAETTALAS